MKKHKFYKHQNCLDMMIYVDNIQYNGLKYIKCRVRYFTKLIFLGGPETIKIKKEDLKYWKEVNG